MDTLTDATQRLSALIDLLNRSAGFHLTAKIFPAHIPALDPGIAVDLSGPEVPLLLARDGELLHAVEHVAGAMLRLEPPELNRIAFDADGFRASRARQLESLADDAVHRVRHTRAPYFFPPMNSRERRLLHLALAPSGLTSASTGERHSRSVVLYPEGIAPTPEPVPDDRRSHPRPPLPIGT
jgi:spoIIIJ-associated protein